jgi:DNA-binding CsgD family transcriptional regulator
MADCLFGCDEEEADDSASERLCWSLMRRIPGAENLPCTENCVSERLGRGMMPVVSNSIRLRGRSFDLRCEPVGEQVVTTLRPVPDPPLDPLSNHEQPLTPREVEVLRLLADGLDGSEIARALGISPGTVRTHVEHMRDSLDCRTRAGLVAKGYRLRYLD